MENKEIKSYRYIWIFGILGFKGLSFFSTGDPSYLFFLAYFSFFAFYPLHRTLKAGTDERTFDNLYKAKNLGRKAALLFLVFIGAVPALKLFATSDTFFIGCASLGLATVILGQVLSFYYYERIA